MKSKKNENRQIKRLMTAAVTAFLLSVLCISFSVNAYDGDFEWSYGDDYDSVIITGYEGYSNEVFIPEKIDGKPVVEIGEGVFADYDITYVTIPDTVTKIGNSAFYNCFELQRVDMSDNVEAIGRYAFSYCVKLTEVQLPSTLKTVGDGAFEGCESLTSVNIPYGVESIGAYAFQSVPAFGKLVIPDTVKTIGEYAFSYCDKLYSVTVPKSVQMLYSTTFGACKILNTINVDVNNKYYKSLGGCLLSKDGSVFYTYPVAKSGAYYTIPSTVKTVENNAFYTARDLVGVVVPWGTTTIKSGAFLSMPKLETITLSASVSSLGDYVFGSDYKLKAINVIAANKTYKSINGVLYSKDGTKLIFYPEGKTDASFAMPNTVKNFYISNSHMTTLKISNKVTLLNYDNFGTCNKLTTVTIPKSVKEIDGAFGSTKLKTINYEGTVMEWYNVYFDDSKVSSAKINCKIIKATSLKFKKKKVSLVCNGLSEYVQLITSPSSAACYTTVKSSNKKIVDAYSFYGDGVMLEAKAFGKATITATNSGKKAKCTVYVKTAEVSMLRKNSKSLKYLVKNIKGYKKAKWSTSNSKIATVTKSGTVKAKKAGSCKIYCKIGKTTYTIKLKVNKPVTAKVLEVYDSGYYRKARIQFNNNTSKKITYISFNITQYNSKGKKIKGPYESYYMNGYIYSNGIYTGSCTVSDSTKKAKVTIKKVYFADGSTWTP